MNEVISQAAQRLSGEPAGNRQRLEIDLAGMLEICSRIDGLSVRFSADPLILSKKSLRLDFEWPCREELIRYSRIVSALDIEDKFYFSKLHDFICKKNKESWGISRKSVMADGSMWEEVKAAGIKVRWPLGGADKERLRMVKALEWSGDLPPGIESVYNHCYAESPLGRFFVTWSPQNADGNYLLQFSTRTDTFFKNYGTLSEAKRGSQDEFARRILECLND